MRTTIELPDELFRRVKAAAALKGKSLKDFLTELLSDALCAESDRGQEYGHPGPIPVTIPPAGRKIKSFTNAELDEIFLREDMEKWDQ